MRNAIAAIVLVAVVVLAANALGVAAAEAPTGVTAPAGTSTAPASATPAPMVGVDGVAKVPVAQGASATVATAAYREAMAAAVADAHTKAEFLAGKAGVTLGSVQSVTEEGGSISCTGGEESAYVEYQGEQPDFPSAAEAEPEPLLAAPRASVRKKKAHKPVPAKKPAAKAAEATSCLLSASVSVAYLVS